MTAFSQPERRGLERLQAQQPHPDADLLSAFSEQTLTPREREQMLAHLAGCALCREVVSLALPKIPEMPTVQAAPKPAFSRWPVLRWTAVGASAVIVVVAVSLGIHEKKSDQLAKFGSETAPLKAQSESRSDEAFQPPASAGVKAPQIRYEKVAPAPLNKLSNQPSTQSADTLKQKEAPAKDVVNLQAGAASGAIVGGVLQAKTNGYTPERMNLLDKKVAAQEQNTAFAATKPVAPAPPPSARLQARSMPAPTETVTVTAAAEMFTIESTTSHSVSPMTQSQTTGGPINVASGKVTKSEAQVHGNFAQSFATNRDLRYQNAISDSQWLVTPEGYLVSSTDQGRNWLRHLPDQRFTNVQSVGNHVWATGPNGALMHSVDRGTNWTRVIPTDKEARLRGDIVGIVFLDVNRGSLQTSTGEIWSTEDAGHSWTKQ
jgi:hypothetical protein